MAGIETYVEGGKLIVRATWETESVPASGDYDTPTDPTTVTFTARRRTPQGVLEAATAYVFGTDAEVTKVSTGVYELAFVPEPGRWAVHAQGTDAAHGSARVTFEIDESEALAA